MKRDGFDYQLTQKLQEEVKEIHPTKELKWKIYDDITKNQGVPKMKKFTIKKFVAIAACICLLVPAGIMAGGKITSSVSSNDIRDYSSSQDWKDLEKMKEKVGIEGEVKKEFSNGYTFLEMDSRAFYGLDQAGNKIAKTKVLDITYVDAKENEINYSMQPSSTKNQKERIPDKDRKINGITVKYFRDTYKFVPEGYKRTKEDQERMEKGNYFVSEGTEKEEIKIYSTVTWEKEGVLYYLSAFDTELTADEMMNMAAEILN